jgi:MFS family permease
MMLSLGVWALGEGLWLNLRSIYIEQLGATPGQVGLVLAISGVARVLFLIPGGWLADRYGPRRTMISSWWLGIVAALAMVLAPDWRWMILGEFLYGASVIVLPALSSYVLLALPQSDGEQNVERAISSIFASFSAGLIFSTPIGGIIADRYGIRSTYWVAIVLFTVSTILVFKLRDYPVPRDEAAGNWRTLMRDRSFLALVTFSFLALLSITFGWPLTPNFLHNVRGFSLSWIGIFAALFSVGTVVWNLTLGQLRPRWGVPSAMGMVWLSSLLLLQSGATLVVGAAYLSMGAIFTTRSLINAAVARRVASAQRGLAFGIAEVCMAMAMSLSPRIAGTLYEIRPGLPFVAGLVSIPLVAVLSFALLLVVRRQAAVRATPAVR